MGHPIRLQILAILCEGEENVGDLARAIGARHSSVSQQLAILRMRGLVSRRRVAGHAVYSMRAPGLREMISCMRRYQAAPPTPVSDSGSSAHAQDLAKTDSQGNGGS